MKKILVINCALCNVRLASEASLDQYERIDINAATVTTSPAARALMARLPITINAASIVDVPEGAQLSQLNGSFEIKPGPPPKPPTVLVVNGRLTIHPGSQEALSGYPVITVNGVVLCPESLASALGCLQVNGRSVVYPDNAILLKKDSVIDEVFALRAKAALYYSPGSLILSDPMLDIAALAAKDVRFSSPRVYIAQDLVEAALPLIDDSADIRVIKAGYAFLKGDQTLCETLLRAQGSRLHVLGDLHIPQEAGSALDQVDALDISGDILLPENLLERFLSRHRGHGRVRSYLGCLISDKGQLRVDEALLALHPQGVTLSSCGVVTLSPDLPASLILEKLRLVACGVVKCTPLQRAAVDSVAEDVGQVDDEADGGQDTDGDGQGDPDTQVINAASYTL